MAGLSPKMTVCIVDAYSSGRYLSACLLRRGHPCVHVQSDSSIPPLLLEGFPKQDFDAGFIHEGDLDRTAEFLKSQNVGTVIVGCETGVELADALQDRMGLPGNGAETTGLRRDKFLMQKALKTNDVPCMAFHETDDFKDLKGWAEGLQKWPIVLKPVKGSGTQGVHICGDLEETRRYFDEIMADPDVFGKPNAAVLVEEFLPGTEYVVNTVSVDGRHIVSDVWEYRKEEVAEGAPVYDYVRLLAYPKNHVLSGLVSYTFSVLDALNIRLGPAHTEIKLTPHGPRLIETGARIMGGAIPPDLINECIGRNQVDLTIDAYLYSERLFEKNRRPYCLKKHLLLKWMISFEELLIRFLPAVEIIRRLPSHRQSFFSVSPGNVMPRTVDMITTPAHVLLCHEDEETLMEDYQILHNLEKEDADCLFEPQRTEQAANAFPPGYDWIEGLFSEAPKNPGKQAEKDAATVDACLGSTAGQRVLMCPSGDGRLALHLARSAALVTCVDIDRRSLQGVEEQFRGLGLTGDFYKMDIRFLPFREEFDVVIVWFNSFGYFPGVDDLASMESLSRALLPKGRLLLESPVLSTIGLRLREDSFRRKPAIQWNERSRIVSGFLCAQRENEKHKIPFRFRIYSEGEYRAMMRSTGVNLERVFTDSRPLFGSGLERLILLGRKG